ncbi:MAG: FAD:protein FMN transferase [Gammaproteobacteria bacterium]
MAAASAALLVPRAASALPAVHWRGRLLGAPADVVLHHDDRGAAEGALSALADEVARLDAVFSLHRADSALARLNRTGSLADAPAELGELLAICRELHAASEGAFDPSVQPLWDAYASHFAGPDADPAGPSAMQLAVARERVGLARVRSHGSHIEFTRPGVALTLNGIAQGYVTDRARALLAAHGMPHALVNLGEYAALGTRPDGGPWRVALAHPEMPWRVLGVAELAAGQALATSAGAGTAFDTARRHHHLIDPRSGRCSTAWRSVSVCAPNATLADGLSTALAVAPPVRAAAILARYPAASAYVLDAAGERHMLGNGFPLV